MASLEVGLLLVDRYRLDERLDSGGGAQVWRATDRELNREVAVKVLLTPEGGDPAFVEAFRAEAQLEAKLKHPGIVEVFDWGHDGDVNYVVMELVEGQTVERLLEGGPLSPERVITLGRQAAGALAYAHAEGVAHGSVGPAHVMVTPEGHTTLIDFGLQCRGACEYPAIPDADTFALGKLLYEALTGASPSDVRPDGLSEKELWPASPHKLNPDIPPELDRVVMKAIAPDSADRYETAAALQAALDELVRPKSRAWLWAVLAILALVIVGVGTWFFASQMKQVVPDVVGMQSAQAESTLSSAGLKMVVTGQTTSPSEPAGVVLAESPASGTKVRRGSQVGVTVSTGKPTAVVPSVSGLTFDAASSSIVGAGLAVGAVTNKTNSSFPPNTVISQSPAAGTELTAGDSVDLVVSSGRAQVTVPDVRGMAQADATAKLTAVGLVAQVGKAYSSQPSGLVVGQGPAAGSSVAKGSIVTISVSQGQAPVKVPNVEGALAADAKTSLQNLGLVPVSVPTTGTAAQVGTVISQDPGPGAKVAPGSQVRIFVGK